MSTLADEVKATVDLAMSMLDEANEFARSQFSTPRPRQTPIDYVHFITDMLRQYPPEPWIRPDGLMVTISPWLGALQFAQGGKQEEQRIRRAMGERGY